MRRIGTFRAVVCLVLIASASRGDGAGPEPAKDVFTAIVGTALGGPPSVVHGTDGRHHVVYELILTNTRAVPATVQAGGVLSGANDTPLVRVGGKQLPGILPTLHVP